MTTITTHFTVCREDGEEATTMGAEYGYPLSAEDPNPKEGERKMVEEEAESDNYYVRPEKS